MLHSRTVNSLGDCGYIYIAQNLLPLLVIYVFII